MESGPRNCRVLFETRIDTVDDPTGAVIETWTPVGYAWCRVVPLRGRESFIDGGVRDDLDTRIETDYAATLAALLPKDRAQFNGTFYNFNGPPIVVEMRNREIHFLCKSGLNDG